jgi:hypothetical protein
MATSCQSLRQEGREGDGDEEDKSLLETRWTRGTEPVLEISNSELPVPRI